jgi:hypothetical protein
MVVAPVVRSLYVCAHADVDPGTRNLTLRNCFREVVLSRTPGRVEPFFVVAYLANAFGPLVLTTEVERLDTHATVFRHRGTIQVPDRLTEVRFKLQVQCTLDVGVHDILLFAGNELIAMSPFTVKLRRGA